MYSQWTRFTFGAVSFAANRKILKQEIMVQSNEHAIPYDLRNIIHIYMYTKLTHMSTYRPNLLLSSVPKQGDLEINAIV